MSHISILRTRCSRPAKWFKFALPLLLAAAATPAPAQITVFDAGNYSQNVLSAARALEQINNQIRQLQNQAAMLGGMAKNLERIDFPQLGAIKQSLAETTRLINAARGIDFDVDRLDAQFRARFPAQFDAALTSDDHVVVSRTRLDEAMAALEQTMRVQSGIVGAVAADADRLSEIAGASQGAEGSLQVAQATNQLLALTAKQQFQIQTMMAAEYRADAVERARRLQAERDARATTLRFLGSGTAYTLR